MDKLFDGITVDVINTVLTFNPDPIFLLGDKGEILDVNMAATDLFGYTASEWVDIDFHEIIAPRSIGDTVKSFAKTLNGDFCSYSVSAYDKEGNLLHLHVKNLPICEAGQQPNKLMIFVKDVTELVKAKDELRKTAEKLMFFYESSAEAMDIIDLDGNVVQVNRAFEEMYGWKAEEIVGRPMPTIPAKQREQVKRDRARVLNNESILGLEVECLKKDGTIIPFSITLSPLHDEHGEIIAFSGISRDISERKKFEEALIRSEEKYRLIAENMTDLVTIIDKDGVIVYASPSLTPVLGFPLEYFEGKSAIDIVHPEDLPAIQEQFFSLYQSKGSAEMEFRYRHKTKEWIWLEAKGTYFVDEKNGEGFILVVSRVIEEKKMMRDKLTQMAFHDELTGLPNRRLFQEIMGQTLKEAKRNKENCALLYMDLDKFKWVNDHYGHSVGDELLKRLSKRVRRSLRESDVFARLGGDEFLVLLPDTEENEAMAIGERVLESLQEAWQIRGNSFTTTSSIGIAMFPQDGATMDELMTNADNALYRAKENGRNTYITYSS
ncbi:sensor domain-containing protein [Sporosarcina luteola]|uniref:sensor domain-containing protein n=1 Tax=Sporosarcina luteola TaxID=582850 RepID=UPI00203D7A18|nr:sensor domain-containing diguanylate cyclase [Sporosarcina luteola]MCM3710733.1 PAS domain S-box protein [Sporosarcina luteola]